MWLVFVLFVFFKKKNSQPQQNMSNKKKIVNNNDDDDDTQDNAPKTQDEKRIANALNSLNNSESNASLSVKVDEQQVKQVCLFC